jgi:hypothetical protein
MFTGKALSVALAMGVAVLCAPAAHAGAGYFTSQDLTASIGAPVGLDQPVGWSTPWDLQRHFAYTTYYGDGRLVVASSAPGGGWTWTTAALNVYPGFLSAYSYSWDHSSHISYIDGTNHHLMELWQSQASPTWQKVDLTVTYNGPLGAMHTHGYEQNGEQHVVFVDAETGTAIKEAIFTPGQAWHFVNVSAQTGHYAEDSQGWYVTATSLGDGGEAIGYIGPDGYPHVLTGPAGRWTDQRVGGPAATGSYYNVNSMAFFRDGHPVRYVLRYDEPDGDVHEVAWQSGGWSDTNITAVTGSRGIASPDQGNDAYLWDADGSEHLFATDRTNGAVHEFVRTRDGRWYFWTDSAPVSNNAGWAAGFAAPDDTVHGTETEFYVYYDSNLHVVIADLTAPYQP